jgi:hypothetical protein
VSSLWDANTVGYEEKIKAPENINAAVRESNQAPVASSGKLLRNWGNFELVMMDARLEWIIGPNTQRQEKRIRGCLKAKGSYDRVIARQGDDQEDCNTQRIVREPGLKQDRSKIWQIYSWRLVGSHENRSRGEVLSPFFILKNMLLFTSKRHIVIIGNPDRSVSQANRWIIGYSQTKLLRLVAGWR